MASVAFVHVGSLYSLSAGWTYHWAWLNAPAERVWAFSVDPYFAPAGQQARFEVVRVEYRYDFLSPLRREVHFWVKNTGTWWANYYIHMAVIKQ